MMVRSSSVALWNGILAGPLAFAIVFELKYALIDYACRNRAHWLFWILFGLGVILCAQGAYEARRGMEPSPRAQFMGVAGIGLSLTFLLFIVAVMIPDLFLRPCQ